METSIQVEIEITAIVTDFWKSYFRQPKIFLF